MLNWTIESEIRVVTDMGTHIESKVVYLTNATTEMMETIMDNVLKSMQETVINNKAERHYINDDSYGNHQELCDEYTTADGRRMLHIVRAIVK